MTSTTMTAREQYAANRADALRALVAMRLRIEMLDAMEAKNPTNWGYAGDMGFIAARMRDLTEAK